MKCYKNVNLYPFNSFRIAAKAAFFLSLQSVENIAELQDFSLYNPLILGGGSNILFTKNYDGWVLKNEIKGIEIIEENETEIILKVGAGEIWNDFVKYAVENNYGGIENLVLIPGTVGAAPIQNIGAYGVEVKDVIKSVDFYHLEDKKFYTLNKQSCTFGYRDSLFKKALKQKIIIVAVTFKLNKKPILNLEYEAVKKAVEKTEITHPTIKNIAHIITQIRRSKLPDINTIGNAGSFFKNPVITKNDFEKIAVQFPAMPHFMDAAAATTVKIPAAWLIEAMGWKGYRKDKYGTYPLQPLVLVNYGGASGKDIVDLAKAIIGSVKQKFGIELHPEVNIL